jgi:hypothetical protein
MVAGERLKDKADTWRSTRSGFGVRVVINIKSRNGCDVLSISSMTAHLPQAPYVLLSDLPEKERTRLFIESLKGSAGFEQFERFAQSAAGGVAQATRLSHGNDGDGLLFDELRFFKFLVPDEGGEQIGIELSGLGNSKLLGDQATTYRFTVRLRVEDSKLAAVKVLSRSAVVAGVRACVFEQDPASWRDPAAPSRVPSGDLWYERRPTRDLDGFRSPRDLPAALESTVGGGTEADFRIRNCPHFARGDRDDPGARQITERPDGNDVRSDDQSAVAAYWNCKDVFDAMHGFGLLPGHYFRACRLPLDVFYRSGVRPGPGKNGRTINAWVKLRKPSASGFFPEDRLGLELHLALGNLNRRWRDPARAPEMRWAEPLGIANSERWMMHEFGHVLIAAVLGEPEFRFAHSIGDGLAAIWADPMSQLADPCLTGVERFRGYTYPWVFTWRRHDRSVFAGWSWSGTLQRSVTEASEADLRSYKGYISEQILSSTLFRLYRCLGGDTEKAGGPERGASDIDRRLGASRLVLYLAMRALESFGHAPLRAEELEAALIDADLGLSTPLTIGSGKAVGGRAHKVIRWAFEAQGMHPPKQDVMHDAPGMPPPVDIFIADRRTGDEVTEHGIVRHGPGSYAPVSLDWSANAQWFSGGSDPVLQLGNRGQLPATKVSLRIWLGISTGDVAMEGWEARENLRWLGGTALSLPDVPGHGQGETVDLRSAIASLCHEAIESTRRANAIILAEISCPDDRANSDPLAGLPTAIAEIGDLPSTPRELADLVATDNNLGLFRVMPVEPAVA